MSSLPSQRTALGTAIAAVGLGAFVMGATLFSGFPKMAIVAGLLASILWTPVIWLSIRLCITASGATRLCLIASVVAGVLDVLIASLIVGIYPGSNRFLDESVPQVAGIAAVVVSSVVYGAPPGLVFGALFVLPVRRVHALYRDKALEVGDRALRGSSGWLAIVSLGCLFLNIMMMPQLETSDWARTALSGGVGAVALLAMIGAIVSHLRIVKRRQWFSRVQEGKEAGWTIVPRSFFAEGLDDLQPLFISGSHHNVALVKHETVEGGGAYRNASNLVPKALVHLPEGLAAMSFSLPNEEQERALKTAD